MTVSQSNDPLMRNLAMTESSCLSVLGLPISFATNCTVIDHQIKDIFTNNESSNPHGDAPSVFAQVQLIRHEGHESESDNRDLCFRMPHPDRLLISTGGSFGVVERDQSRAYAYVTESVIEDVPFFRRAFVETMALFLASGPERFPIHAASIGLDDCAVLLAGGSGCGKSTLAFVAANHGFVAFGEDVVYVQVSPALRAWTLPGDITLLPEVASRYTATKDITPTRLATGKQKVIAANRPAIRLDEVSRLRVCVLSPGHETASVDAISAHELSTELLSHVEDGFDVYSSETREEVVQALACDGGWRLNLSSNPEDSMPLIRQVLLSIQET